MRAAIVHAAIGILVLVASGPTIYQMSVESRVSRSARARYEIDRIYANHADFHGNHISISDALDISKDATAYEALAPVKITVNNKDYSNPALVRIRQASVDTNRYHGSLAIATLRDKQLHTERLGIIQYLHDPEIKHSDFRTRLLLVNTDGTVDEDIFPFSQRASPPYRYMFMYTATIATGGFVYSVYDVWPSIFYPLLFPFGVGLTAIILILRALLLSVRHFRQNKTTKANP